MSKGKRIDGISIQERPSFIVSRDEFGHWEIGEYQQNYALMEKMLSTYDICKINIIKHFSILSHLIINWLNKISK